MTNIKLLNAAGTQILEYKNISKFTPGKVNENQIGFFDENNNYVAWNGLYLLETEMVKF